jgi:hypothetical protein
MPVGKAHRPKIKVVTKNWIPSNWQLIDKSLVHLEIATGKTFGKAFHLGGIITDHMVTREVKLFVGYYTYGNSHDGKAFCFIFPI